MRRAAGLLAATLLSAPVTGADEALAQCAAMDTDLARLACYDALAGRMPGTAPAPALPARAAAEDFGKPAALGLDAIEARIVGSFKEWRRGTLIRLDNGQVWQAVNDEIRYYPSIPDNAEVTVSQGTFGYSLTIKAIKRRIAVKRVS